ncbi:MAG: NAD-dependent epimerase/dehydratase family protein [Candidatus Lokiarchaeota archaeon]|nr:NAD-dependent epimerase/dehydratase family protein [Candidatus Lokiarchaeota archaeon]
MQILVTGGLGFIGGHLVDKLVQKGHAVRVLDSMEFQVHQGKFPPYANDKAEYVIGNVLDRAAVRRALEGAEVVFHDAAAVGVGQSMYQVHHYVEANAGGTAMILDELVNGNHPIKKLIVAASNTVYGEGLYDCPACGKVEAPLRDAEQIKRKEWDVRCPKCAAVLKPAPTPETKSLDSTNIYALTKKYQEELCMSVGRTYGIPVTSLRYFNVYGPRQSLSNPYTGVACIFISRLKNGNPPYIYEDGLQTRDFIHVNDVAGVNVFAMEHAAAEYQCINVGTGNPVTIKGLAERLAAKLGSGLGPTISNEGRPGDIRHCFADVSKLKGLGYQHEFPAIDLDTLVEWSTNTASVDRFVEAKAEFDQKLGMAR